MDWYDQITDTAGAAWDSVASTVSDGIDSIEGAYDQAIQDFKDKLQQLDEAQQNLLNVEEIARQDPADYQEFQQQQTKINALASTIQSVKDATTGVERWWGNVTSSFGLNGLKGKMGFLPAIPVATAIAVTAAIAAVVLSVNAFVNQMNAKYSNAVVQNTKAREQYRQDLKTQGNLSAEAIEQQVNQVYPMITAVPESGLTDQIASLMKLGIVAAFVYFMIKEQH